MRLALSRHYRAHFVTVLANMLEHFSLLARRQFGLVFSPQATGIVRHSLIIFKKFCTIVQKTELGNMLEHFSLLARRQFGLVFRHKPQAFSNHF